jgi:hypothetical protein
MSGWHYLQRIKIERRSPKRNSLDLRRVNRASPRVLFPVPPRCTAQTGLAISGLSRDTLPLARNIDPTRLVPPSRTLTWDPIVFYSFKGISPRPSC